MNEYKRYLWLAAHFYRFSRFQFRRLSNEKKPAQIKEIDVFSTNYFYRIPTNSHVQLFNAFTFFLNFHFDYLLNDPRAHVFAILQQSFFTHTRTTYVVYMRILINVHSFPDSLLIQRIFIMRCYIYVIVLQTCAHADTSLFLYACYIHT